MLYGTDCKYSTCFVCVDGEICGLQWSEEASFKKLDLSCIFKDGLDLNGLLFWEEAALSGKKKEPKRIIKRVRPHGHLSLVSACSWSPYGTWGTAWQSPQFLAPLLLSVAFPYS